MNSQKETVSPCLAFGAIADIQYADTDDGYNFSMTSLRYYRTALTMLDIAVDKWNNDKLKKPQFVLQLGDIIDGKNKGLGISDTSLATVVKSFSEFSGPVYHIWGNHEFYNFSREALLSSAIFSGQFQDCIEVKGKTYYASIPHPKLRILALDTYEVSLLASVRGTDEYALAVEIMKNNQNEDKNSSDGMQGIQRRLVQYNGGLSQDQVAWIKLNLEEAKCLQQNVILMGRF